MTHSYPDPADAPWALLARHLAAEATASERAALRTWVQADPTHLQILATVTRAWERAGEAAAAPVLFSPTDVEAAWQRFRPLMAPAPVPARPAPTGPSARPRLAAQRRPRWQLAAGLVVLLGASYAFAKALFLKPEASITTYASTTQRRQVQLPDGSTVWLNAHSQLRYTGAGTAPGTRAVQLTGEAYFEVLPNPARPFVLSTTTARLRTAGTAFHVRAYAAEDSVEVSVGRGQVWLARLAAPVDSVLLTAGTRAALRATDAPGRVAARLRSSPAANANFRAWQTDTLRFADTPVAQVIQTLRATFGTNVLLAGPSLGQCRFTGTFSHPQPGQVLAVLATATASRLTPDGQGGYRLQGPGCAAPAQPASEAVGPTAQASGR
ncbi:MAG: FecR family protein [Janthinobacterium lividum]